MDATRLKFFQSVEKAIYPNKGLKPSVCQLCVYLFDVAVATVNFMLVEPNIDFFDIIL